MTQVRLKSSFDDSIQKSTITKIGHMKKYVAISSKSPSLYPVFSGLIVDATILGVLLLNQVSNVKKTVTGTGSSSFSGMRQELMKLPSPHHTGMASSYVAKDNDDFISSESDRQMLLIR